MSRFIKKLETVGQANPAPLGFGTRAQRESNPTMLVVGTLTVKQLGEVSSLANSQVDAFLVKAEASELDALAEVSAPLEGLLWGVRISQVDAKEAEMLKEKGCDFLVFDAEGTSADVLQDQELGKVLTIDMNLEEDAARAIEDLPVDAFFLVPPKDLFPLTVQRLLNLQSIRSMIAKPCLMEISGPPGGKGLQGLRDAAVDGVVMVLPKGQSKAIKEVRQGIDSMPQRKPKIEQREAVVPRLGSTPSAPRHRHEEEEEDEEEES